VPIFCLDIGNTHAHWGLVDGRAVLAEGKVATQSLRLQPHEVLQKILQPLGHIYGVAFCSVVPAINGVVLAEFGQWGLTTHHLRHDTVVGLGFDYPNPAEVGQDRLANCMGAQLLVGAPAVIIDMGTATTFDILTQQGYAGGIIAPGVQLMTRYLHEQTALLPALDPADLLGGAAIGRSTVEAMKTGCAVGFAGMIGALLESVVHQMQQTGKHPAVIATGGTAAFLPASWAGKIRWEPHITLLGLAESYRRASA
jgi:type III pantothenate kinase